MLKKPQISDDLKKELDDYIHYGVLESSFLKAILTNNLLMSFSFADEEQKENLESIVSYLHWEIPGNVWGNNENVKNHLNKFE